VDPISRRFVDRLRLLALSKVTVLLRGESGTGKHLASTLLHDISPQRDEPLVRLDCAGTPSHLLERYIVGDSEVRSRFELAGSGTVVLEEIAALSMNMQSKLLRLIDQRELEREGHTIRIHARIVALTSADLERAIARRSFREDLYYRLSVTSLVVAPLRDRPDDVIPLAEHFLAQFAQMHRRPKLALQADAREALLAFPCPGNIRQLRSIMHRTAATVSGPEIRASDLPAELRPASSEPIVTLEVLERDHIARVLQLTQGKKSQAAQLLGISRKTLLEKRKRYRLP